MELYFGILFIFLASRRIVVSLIEKTKERGVKLVVLDYSSGYDTMSLFSRIAYLYM